MEWTMKKYMIPWWKTDLGKNEIKKIEQSILSGNITQGPVTHKLESCLAKLLDVPYAVLTINGSSALLMSLLASGIKPGDEIIIPNLTFVATALAPRLLGAKIKLVDVGCLRPLIDVEQVKKAITGKTKAIIPVHLNGMAADIGCIYELGQKHGITVIEDAAQALCSRNSSGCLGVQSDMGIFSLAITKLITTVQGGLVVTRSKKLFDKLKAIRDYGITKRDRLLTPGFNFKFNDILASIGLSQFEKVREKIKAIKDNYIFYRSELKFLDYIHMIEARVEEGEIPLWTEVLCRQRDKVSQLLKRKGILTKPFDRPVCELLPDLSKKHYRRSEGYVKSGLILPSGPDQPKDNLQYVVATLKNIKNKI